MEIFFTPEIIEGFVKRITDGEDSSLLTSASGLRSKVEELIEVEKQFALDIQNATSLEDLCDLVQNSDLIRDDHPDLEHKSLVIDITTLSNFDPKSQSDKIDRGLQYITRSFGIRAKVRDLINKKIQRPLD